MLPVEKSCPWWHQNGISRKWDACRALDDSKIRHYTDLWPCIEEAGCKLTGEALAEEEGSYTVMADWFETQTYPGP